MSRAAMIGLFAAFAFSWGGWASVTLWSMNERLTRVEAVVCPPQRSDRLAGVRP